RRGLGLFRLQVFCRLGLETPAAARRAEQILLSLVGEAVLRGLPVDGHAADRIDRGRCFNAFVGVAKFAAAAGLRLRAMVMAGVSRAGTVCVILMHLRHQSLLAT